MHNEISTLYKASCGISVTSQLAVAGYHNTVHCVAVWRCSMNIQTLDRYVSRYIEKRYKFIVNCNSSKP